MESLGENLPAGMSILNITLKILFSKVSCGFYQPTWSVGCIACQQHPLLPLRL